MKNLLKAAATAALLVSFSCSTDPVPEAQENLAAVNAKSSKSILKTLVKGAALKAANGIDVGPDGNLYVASVNGREFVVINKNSGKIIRRFGPDDGVDGPDDLIIDPAGEKVYWTDIITGEIGSMNLDGTGLKKQFVAPGVNPIRFSEGGRLFTALDFLGDGLYELDPELNDPPQLIISCPEGFGLGFFNSFDTRVENDRLILYGPLFALNLVIAIDVDAVPDDAVFPADLSGLIGAQVAGYIRIVADSDLFNPAAAKFGPDGMLYVLDQAGKVFRVNPDGADDKTLYTSLQPGLDNMAFDDDGTLYMTNNDEGWVAEILSNGRPRYLSPGGMILPQGLAAVAGPNNQDRVFEGDLFKLRQFNGTSGRQEKSFEGNLINPLLDQLILPMTVFADGDDLILTSWFSAAVQVFDPQTESVENVAYGFDFVPKVPIDAVRVGGDILISEFALGGVVRASDNTNVLPLPVSSGLATDGETLWAADWANGQVLQLDYGSGATTPTTVATGLSFPEGLALDNDGRLVVIETSGPDGSGPSRVSRIDLSVPTAAARDNVTILAEDLQLSGPGLGLPYAPPTWGFDGVAVGPSGDIYISGSGATVIYKIAASKVP